VISAEFMPPSILRNYWREKARLRFVWLVTTIFFCSRRCDHHHLRVEFSVAAEHKGEPGRMANAGDGHGIATIRGNIASFTPDGADADCRITLKFSRHNLVVTQTSKCDFGKYANADGTHKKISTSKPVFRFAP
jgi:hypothetical protein